MNRSISWLIVTFVATSLLATTLPLLEAGGGRELVATVGRGDSLRLYALFLVAFLSIVLPAFLKRNGGESVRAWATVTTYVLVFATIPLLFTAYISGVSARGLLSVGGICATAAGLPLALQRLFPKRACVIAQGLAAIGLFAIPTTSLFLESLDRSAPGLWTSLSPVALIERFTTLRETPHPVTFLIAPVLLWAAALGPFRRKSVALSATSALLLFFVGAAALPPAPALEVEVTSLSGGKGRAGCRLPLLVRVRGGSDRASLRLGSWSAEIPASEDGIVVLAVPGPEDRELLVRSGDAEQSVRIPVELVPADQRLVGFWGAEASPLPATPDTWVVARIDADKPYIQDQVGALEAFDAVIIDPEIGHRIEYDETGKLQTAFDHYTLAGGTYLRRANVLVTRDRRRASGREVLLNEGDPFPEISASRAGSAFDLGLWKTFAPPRWQEMDLSALLLFAVVYHLAFLLAFLLPLLIDAKKTVGVYLVSVGFVVIVVFLLAYNVLGRIFLKDNQLYTQGVSLLWVETPQAGQPPLMLSRRFLGFASMSSEQRDLELQTRNDVLLYRDPRLDPSAVLSRSADGVTLQSVALDRFRKKILVRVDDVFEAPLGIEVVEEGFRLNVRDGVRDPLDLLRSRIRGAHLIEGFRRTRSYRSEGQLLIPRSSEEPLDSRVAKTLAVQKMLGHFGPKGRFLVVEVTGLKRPDDPTRYLWARDLGAWLVFEI